MQERESWALCWTVESRERGDLVGFCGQRKKEKERDVQVANRVLAATDGLRLVAGEVLTYATGTEVERDDGG